MVRMVKFIFMFLLYGLFMVGLFNIHELMKQGVLLETAATWKQVTIKENKRGAPQISEGDQ
jgi:hypothetical protein